MSQIPPIPEDLKRWSPAARLEECGKPHGYMIGDKEGLWYFASAVDERITKLTEEVEWLSDSRFQLAVAHTEDQLTIERLEAENTRLKAPVMAGTAEYMAAPYRSIAAREFFNFVIRSRAAIKEGQ